jgi:hypothetical protein
VTLFLEDNVAMSQQFESLCSKKLNFWVPSNLVCRLLNNNIAQYLIVPSTIGCDQVEDWEAKYAECCELLVEAQRQLRLQQEADKQEADKQEADAIVVHQHFASANPIIPEGSLAQELEDTIRRELQLSGKEPSAQRK